MPDYRGLFLRGHGSQAHAQENGTTVGVTITTHSSGTLGSVQGDAIRNITGRIDTGTHMDYGTGPFYSSAGPTPGAGMDGPSPDILNFDISRVVATAQENRPVNTAVRYLIRALP